MFSTPLFTSVSLSSCVCSWLSCSCLSICLSFSYLSTCVNACRHISLAIYLYPFLVYLMSTFPCIISYHRICLVMCDSISPILVICLSLCPRSFPSSLFLPSCVRCFSLFTSAVKSLYMCVAIYMYYLCLCLSLRFLILFSVYSCLLLPVYPILFTSELMSVYKCVVNYVYVFASLFFPLHRPM